MAKTSSMHIRINPKVKKKVEAILKKFGITITEAINIYLYQIILNAGIPFEIKCPQFDKDLLEALKEAEEIEKNPKNYKSYKNLAEIMENLDNE